MSERYDPMTGELLRGAEMEQGERYDPMTGELLTDAKTETDDKYDPMTGELLTGAAEPERRIVGYDPMTGEPVYERENSNNVLVPLQPHERNFDPMTGRPVRKGKSKRKWFIALGTVAVVFLVIFVGVKSGLFLSKSNKVLAALVNTLEDQPHLIQNLEALNLLSEDSYTVGAAVKMDDGWDKIAYDVQYSVSSSEKQASGNISVDSYWGEEYDIDFVAAITSSQVKLQLPEMDSRVFSYNYKEEKDGYLTQILNDDGIEAIDSMCEALYSTKEQKDLQKKISKIVLKEYQSLKFKKVGKEEFEIDGKDRKCKGYQTTITEDNLVNICDEIEQVIEEKYGDTLEEAYIDIDDVFDDLCDELEEVPDIDVTFYLYHNKIACVSLEAEGEEVQILLKGGEKGMQNIEVVVEDYGTVMELKSSVKGTTEKYQLEIDETEVGTLEYNYKSGDFTIESGRYYDSISIEGNLQGSSKEMTLSVDEFEDDYGDELEFTLYIKKGASMQKLKGTEFDLGNASEEEWEELIDDLGSMLDF